MLRCYVLGAHQMRLEDLLIESSIRDEILMKEKVVIELWNVVSEFHADLAQPLPPDPCGFEPDSDEDDGLPLTEEEKVFHAKFIAESNAQLVVGLAREKTTDVNKFVRNAFLPIALARWIESEARAKGDKICEFDTFDHLAPISVNGYRLFASLTVEEVDLCCNRTLDENTKLIKGLYPRTAEAMKLPIVGHFDPLKCSVSPTTLAIRGFYPPKGQTALAELKRVWNVGRPYLKCRCQELGKGECKSNITSFDHVFRYILANPDYLFPAAPTLHAKMRAMRTFLKMTWRAPILASVVFSHMRGIMVNMAQAVVVNPATRQEKILGDEALMMRKFPRKMASLILPDRYIKSSSKRRLSPAKDARPAKRQCNTTLSYYVMPQHEEALGEE
ncbi:hypothetical protein CBR_g8724 [Chara braunii]|uniref:Uncharacterized protein n=1 Tax=Chara braunii TaxID=69332 RepID=A0A388KMY6_CHABU|nr:hypothetical protein CBR_g8724 [Chara braunii]|eukprot:GBG71303.1 hypothetical protein CBR_g8724 [Chara braunii]